jgi:hypothetical protein
MNVQNQIYGRPLQFYVVYDVEGEEKSVIDGSRQPVYLLLFRIVPRPKLGKRESG